MTTAVAVDPRTQDLLQRIRSFALPDARLARATGTWLTQRGEIRFGPDRRWLPYRATQEFDATGLGFRWRAWVTMAPLLYASVVDAFEAGRGRLSARVLGIRFMHAVGPEVDRGECQRLLAELPWCPMAFGHPALSWQAADGRTLAVGYGTARHRPSVLLEIDEVGRVVSVSADDRPRLVGKQAVPTRWTAHIGGYRELAGMRVPASFSVGWEPAGGPPFSYARGEIRYAGVSTPALPQSR